MGNGLLQVESARCGEERIECKVQERVHTVSLFSIFNHSIQFELLFRKQEGAKAAAPLPSSDPCRGRQEVVGSGGDATF